MKYLNILLFSGLLVLLVVSFACSGEEKQRQELRKKLDAEFEKDTKELVRKSTRLSALLKKLVEEHEEMDRKHAKMDTDLIGKKLVPEDEKIQKNHLEWEKRHKTVIANAEELRERFNRTREEHERMEARHATATPEQIKKEHEQFEKDLKGYKREFIKVVSQLKRARKQMKVIFIEHKALEEKYKK